MENLTKPQDGNSGEQDQTNDGSSTTKENKYTPLETEFADGEGQPLDKAIDGDADGAELTKAGESAGE